MLPYNVRSIRRPINYIVQPFRPMPTSLFHSGKHEVKLLNQLITFLINPFTVFPIPKTQCRPPASIHIPQVYGHYEYLLQLFGLVNSTTNFDRFLRE